MTPQEVVACVAQAIEKTKGQSFTITAETDLVEDTGLDSLDGMVFMMEMEKLTGCEFPRDVDPEEAGLFTLPKLIAFYADHQPAA